MVEVASGGTSEVLHYLHGRLSSQFHDLHATRSSAHPPSPVFALEHDLQDDELDLLRTTVGAAVLEGLGAQHRQWWLPFVVYAAESGYDYVGDEYWHTFEQTTPGWRAEQRTWIKSWFRRFAAEYGGAVPVGAFAETFSIIAWPITHAVLPTYLQRHLAHLLFDFSRALTSDLLDRPEALGERLASRASGYTERFRIFCQNTALLGQVAAALLGEHDQRSPYLVTSTLERLVADISREQRARLWLSSARQSANRARTSGFVGLVKAGTHGEIRRIPRTTDPRLFLRQDGAWSARAELPDLAALETDLPRVYEELRNRRALVSGVKKAVPRSGLLYDGQEVEFSSWPRTDEPFVQLDGTNDAVNRILADRCGVTAGPWWLFRRQSNGLATEVKGKAVRPGHRYVLIGADQLSPPDVTWAERVPISVSGVAAYHLDAPTLLTETDEAALKAAGVLVSRSVAIRPVGIVASAWDGEGEVEWPAGEPAMLGIRSDLLPIRTRVVVDGMVYFLECLPGEPELLFTLEGLPVGAHEVGVALLGDGDRQLASGSLVVTVRDPQVRPDGATLGEGIRLLATPARPTLAELWDERAVVTIDGPLGTHADLRIRLLDGQGEALAELRRTVRLPLGEADWRTTAKSIRTDQRFRETYDAAESCSLTVARDGVGFATLTCERGFQPLRWRFTRTHDGDVLATLIDRTDGGRTTLDLYDVEAPLTAVQKNPGEPLAVPTRGGLAVARACDTVAAAILPTNPNALRRLSRSRPVVTSRSHSPMEVLRLAEGHQRWIGADLPADAFAAYEQQIVGDAIARAIGTLIGGSHWAAIERKLATAPDIADHLDGMQDAVGISTEHKALASTIAYKLYEWLTPEDLLFGFDEVITPHLASHGITGRPAMPRFLLMLAARPGDITEWDANEAAYLLERVMKSPVLYRAARFAVLGTRALDDAEGVDRRL